MSGAVQKKLFLIVPDGEAWAVTLGVDVVSRHASRESARAAAAEAAIALVESGEDAGYMDPLLVVDGAPETASRERP